MDAFRPFTLTHAAALLGIAAACWLLVEIGRAQRDETRPTKFEKWLAAANLVLWTAAHGWWLMPPRLDFATTLPLQLCHLAAVIASLALLARAVAARAALLLGDRALNAGAAHARAHRAADIALVLGFLAAARLHHGRGCV